MTEMIIALGIFAAGAVSIAALFTFAARTQGTSNMEMACRDAASLVFAEIESQINKGQVSEDTDWLRLPATEAHWYRLRVLAAGEKGDYVLVEVDIRPLGMSARRYVTFRRLFSLRQSKKEIVENDEGLDTR